MSSRSRSAVAAVAVALLCVSALASHALADEPQRTALPENMYVEVGLFDCVSAEGGFCVGTANGVIRAFLRFDPVTSLMTNYREEAVLNNTALLYNRELATATSTKEYSLLAGSNALTCLSLNVAGTLSRFYLQNATFAGNTTVRDIPAWEFTGQWYARGPLMPYTAWVSRVAPFPVLGWRSGGVTYIYLSYQSWPQGFPADTFAEPDVQCSAAPTPAPEDGGKAGVKGLRVLGQVLSAFVAFEHMYFLLLEMVLWRGRAMKVFRTTAEFAHSTASLAANQGLYNGFLSAGIVYGLAADELVLLSFALACVVVAGVFGALTASRTILFVQAFPAIFALIAVQFGNKHAGTWDTANPLITLIWAAIGVLFGGVLLGVYVCRRETALGSYDRTRKALVDAEAPSSANPTATH